MIGFIYGFFIGAILIGFCGLYFGTNYVDECWKNDVIKRGYGSMQIIDTLSGETKFFWKDSLK